MAWARVPAIAISIFLLAASSGIMAPKVANSAGEIIVNITSPLEGATVPLGTSVTLEGGIAVLDGVSLEQASYNFNNFSPVEIPGLNLPLLGPAQVPFTVDLGLPVEGPNVACIFARGTLLDGSPVQDMRCVNFTAAAVEPPNNPPTVMITRPLDGDEFAAPAIIRIEGTAQDSDGRITRVELFLNDVLEDTIVPSEPLPFLDYVFEENIDCPSTDCIIDIWVAATDDGGATTVSDRVRVTVTKPLEICQCESLTVKPHTYTDFGGNVKPASFGFWSTKGHDLKHIDIHITSQWKNAIKCSATEDPSDKCSGDVRLSVTEKWTVDKKEIIIQRSFTWEDGQIVKTCEWYCDGKEIQFDPRRTDYKATLIGSKDFCKLKLVHGPLFDYNACVVKVEGTVTFTLTPENCKTSKGWVMEAHFSDFVELSDLGSHGDLDDNFAPSDWDGDGDNNAKERALGTDPLDPDSRHVEPPVPG